MPKETKTKGGGRKPSSSFDPTMHDVIIATLHASTLMDAMIARAYEAMLKVMDARYEGGIPSREAIDTLEEMSEMIDVMLDRDEATT